MILQKRYRLKLLLFVSAFFMICFPHQLIGQSYNHSLVSLSKQSVHSDVYIPENTSLKKALSIIENKYNVVFLYESGKIEKAKVKNALKAEGLYQALNKLFEGTGLKYKKVSGRTFGIVERSRLRSQEAAQQVSGVVTDGVNGDPLPSVNVIVKGTTIGTFTDSDGHYSVTAPSAQDSLVFSFVGYKKRVVPIRGRSTIDIEMQTAALSGKELVVVGYGTQQSRDVNGSIATVSAEDIENTPEVSVSQMLQGKAAGVSVSQNSGTPGGATSVRIRGITSISGNNEPLYIIDGVPVSGDANNTATSGRTVANNFTGQDNDTVSPLSGLNPDDIKSISILKDASAQAIYGSRGANGVVIITTKSGQAGQSKISYNGYMGTQEPVKELDLMKLPEYARLTNQLATLSGREPNAAFLRPEILGPGTDWQNAIFRNSVIQNHQLSFSGGIDDITYYISGGYLQNDGIVLGSSFDRYTLKTNVDAQVTDWFKMGVKVNGSTSDQDLPVTGSPTGAINLALTNSPAVPVYNADGTFAGPTTDSNGNTVGDTNPVARALTITNTVDRNKFLGNLYGIIDLADYLTFQSSFGGNIEEVHNKTFQPTYQRGTEQNDVATARDGRQTYKFWDWKNYFTFKKTFLDKHDVTFLLGQEAQKSSWEGVSASATGFVSNNVNTLNLGEPSTSSGFAGEYTLASYYTRLIYSFENKYGLTATFRADGSSKFDEGNRWGYFPSIGASWKIYQEPFMKGFNNYVDELTFKVGYGLTGNQDIGNYLYSANLNPISTGLGKGFGIGNISNPDLQWEEQKQLNLGVSFSLLDNHLSAEVEGYNKISDKFLFQLPLPSYLTGGPAYQGGINPPFVNLGEIQNRGIDITINANARSKDFSWNSTLTFSHFTNEVKALDSRVDITETYSTGFINTPITRTVRGKPVGLFYGYKVKGIFNDESTIRDQPNQFGADFNPPDSSLADTWLGDIQYEDVNGDGVIDEQDRTFIGNPHPDFTFGFNNSFGYKNFSLSIFLQGSYGNDIMNLSRLLTTGLNRPYRNQLAEASDYWTPDNRDAKFPRPKPGDDNPNIKVSDRYVEDGSYLRVKNLKLGYTLPTDLTQRFNVSKLHVYGSVQNLLTFTDYSGYDPDVGSFNQIATRTGIDFGRYPQARIFQLGLNVDF